MTTGNSQAIGGAMVGGTMSTEILQLRAEVERLTQDLDVCRQIDATFWLALKPLHLQAINVQNPGQHVTDVIAERDEVAKDWLKVLADKVAAMKHGAEHQERADTAEARLAALTAALEKLEQEMRKSTKIRDFGLLGAIFTEDGYDNEGFRPLTSTEFKLTARWADRLAALRTPEVTL